MHGKRWFVGALVVVAMGVAASAWQRAGGPATPAAPPVVIPTPTGVGLLVGRVVDAATKAPIAGATVMMNGSGVVTNPPPGVRTSPRSA